MTAPLEPDEITLKWGTLKGWHPRSAEAHALLQKYMDIGASMSCMAQQDTQEQRQILIDLVSLPNAKIYLDWDGEYVTKDEAIKYLTEYGKEKVA